MSGVKFILLCEDKQTNAFVRRFLKCRNLDLRDITTLPLPDGSQSGEQWVRQRYPRELKSIRSRQNARLIVVTDADSGSTENRRKQLDRECIDQNIACRTDDDRVFVIIPRRNIETWLAYLDGTTVNENENYPRLHRERDCRPHVGKLFKMCQENRLCQPVPPSLSDACREYRRSGQWRQAAFGRPVDRSLWF
ncbi:MAG: hypothetical protein OXC91_01105 [Rhodobacteraceae bacterium]|nr:hypothetical protein [Paracoccaceae bacterium]